MLCRARDRARAWCRRRHLGIAGERRRGAAATEVGRYLGMVWRQPRRPSCCSRGVCHGAGRRNRCHVRAVQHPPPRVHARRHKEPVRPARRVHASGATQRDRWHEDDRLRQTALADGPRPNGCHQLLATSAWQHRRVGHGRRVSRTQSRPDSVEHPQDALGDHAQHCRAGDRCEAVRQLLADDSRPSADRPAWRRTGCCRSPSTTATSAPAWREPSTPERR